MKRKKKKNQGRSQKIIINDEDEPKWRNWTFRSKNKKTVGEWRVPRKKIFRLDDRRQKSSL